MSKPLQLNDLFWTLQGEGKWSGYRALFIRLPYCNYDCPWCDTEYNSFKEWSEESFKDFIDRENSRFAVITGGEPMAHKDLSRIIKILKDNNFYIACETNGSFEVPSEIDFVTVSPKKHTRGKFEEYYVHPKTWEMADEFKYVVEEGFDFSILDRHTPNNKNKTYSLSPEYSTMEKSTQRILEFTQHNPHWRLNLQTHKWINIP